MLSGYLLDHFTIQSDRSHMPWVNGRRGLRIAFYTPSKVGADIASQQSHSIARQQAPRVLRLSVDSQPDEVG